MPIFYANTVHAFFCVWWLLPNLSLVEWKSWAQQAPVLPGVQPRASRVAPDLSDFLLPESLVQSNQQPPQPAVPATTTALPANETSGELILTNSLLVSALRQSDHLPRCKNEFDNCQSGGGMMRSGENIPLCECVEGKVCKVSPDAGHIFPRFKCL